MKYERFSIRDIRFDGGKQLQESLAVVKLTWEHVPHNDMVPAMRPDVGCSCLATAFGAELYWGDDENQTCGVKNPPLSDVSGAYDLQVPPPDAGQLGEGIRRVRRFAEAGDGLVAVSLLDMAGGLNVAAEPQEAIEAFQEIMELMAPDVIVIPHVIVPLQKNPHEVYRRM